MMDLETDFFLSAGSTRAVLDDVGLMKLGVATRRGLVAAAGASSWEARRETG